LITSGRRERHPPVVQELAHGACRAWLRDPDGLRELTDRQRPGSIQRGEERELACRDREIVRIEQTLRVRLETLTDALEPCAERQVTELAYDILRRRAGSRLHAKVYNM
jgi:hypothetical protein